MQKPLADPVDVGLLASGRKQFERRYALADFERLRDVLASTAGAADVEFRFHVLKAAGHDLPAVDGIVRARPRLSCQRCLGTYEQPVESALRLAFPASEQDAASVPEEYEPIVATSGRVRLAELVEDELLLALPLIPAHASPGECEAPAESPAAETGAEAPADDEMNEPRRPFAGLRQLLDR